MAPPILAALSDFPVSVPADQTARFEAAFDTEGKIPRALETLGPIHGRDVLLIDCAADGRRARELADLGGRVQLGSGRDVRAGNVGAESVDAVVSPWSWFRDDLAADLAAAERVLRVNGRLLVIHDYGRDDVSRLRAADLPEYTTWSRRDGWFLRNGFKVRVIHAWWTFPTLDAAVAVLEASFGESGRAVGAGLKRPRLSYNVAIYHRPKGGDSPVQ